MPPPGPAMTDLLRQLRATDLLGCGRLALDASLGVTDVVEQMQQSIWRSVGRFGLQAPAEMAAGWVFDLIRGVNRLVGSGLDLALGSIGTPAAADVPAEARDAAIAILNGLAGDHLADRGNPLAISMAFRHAGRTLEPTPTALARALPDATGRILLLAHGLCLNDRHWRRNGHDHGAALAVAAGFTPVYLHYNSGLHVSVNGRDCADLLEELVDAWPVPVVELSILGHSMGGLVARSACHYGAAAGLRWPALLRSLVFLGTPHHGAPLEQGGSWIDAILEASPYTTALARLGKVRSAGITDLRHGSLLDEDWQRKDGFAGARRRPGPLPAGVRCCAIGACITRPGNHLGSRVIGDGLVPLASALGQHEDPGLDLPEAQTWVGHGLHHLDLLDDSEVFARIKTWLS